MADSDSSLSSPPSTDDEMTEVVAPVQATKATPQKKKKNKKNGTILSFFKSPSPVRKKRPASPPHEMVPEDNPDIAFIVMFRSRFAEAFPPKTPHFGPQDIERGIAEGIPSPQVETLLCALLALLLNRKKPVEKGHYGRALEEAIQGHRSQWPRAWNYTNPISGGRSFNTMSPLERLTLLKQLVLWSLHDSEVVNNMIKETYKSRTTKDKNDTNIPLSVQPWGRDGDNRQYWLVEGQDDTSFRVYRESNRKLKTITWWNVAGSIEEIRALAQKLEEEDGTRDAKLLADKMRNAIPRFEATETKRKRREYKANRDAAFQRPQPGYSIYEGRTRGKRTRYTFSDEEEEYSDALGIRRSTRNSGKETPAEPAGPTVTASGRQVKSRATGLYGESLLSGQTTDMASPATGDYVRSDGSEEPRPTHGRATRASGQGANDRPRGRKHIDTYNSVDEMDDEDDATSWDGGDEDDDEADQMDLDDVEEVSANESSGEDEPKSLVVRLRYTKSSFTNSPDVVPSHKAAPAIGPPTPNTGPALATAPAPAPPPAAPAQATVPPPQVVPNVQANGYPNPQELPLNPITSVVQDTTLPGIALPLPSMQPQFSAPTPPYAVQEEAAPKPAYVAQGSTTHPDSHSFQPTSLPQPTPASSWQ